MAHVNTQLYSGGLRPFPGIPSDWSDVKQATARGILGDVQAVCPALLTAVQEDADIEDFWEDACRISAAYLASGKQLAFKDPGTSATPWDASAMSRRLGPVGRSEEGGHHAVDTLIDHPLVRKYGGRAMILGSLGGDPATDIIQWLACRHRDAGVARGVVKATARKNGVWSIELDSDPAVVRKRLLEVMDWSFFNLEERANAVVAQDELELNYEYRLFVVDGEVVSGAGCVEEYTPLDRRPDGGAFDTRVRRIRGHLNQGEPSRVVHKLEAVVPLVEFGKQVAREHGGTVVIDVALDAASGNTPVVIELNSMPNSGLYASDPWLVAERLICARDRGYEVPAARSSSVVRRPIHA